MGVGLEGRKGEPGFPGPRGPPGPPGISDQQVEPDPTFIGPPGMKGSKGEKVCWLCSTTKTAAADMFTLSPILLSPLYCSCCDMCLFLLFQ